MSASGPYLDDLRFALRMADAVDSLTLASFRSDTLAVEAKADNTPVSDADRAAEQLIREMIGSERPGDSIYGEEYGVTGGGARQWIIDPIDGTKNYVRGVPVWATLIALVEGGEPVMSVVSAPALGMRWFAAAGGGAWAGQGIDSARRLRVSTIDRLEDATLSYSSLSGWEALDKLPAFLALGSDVWRTRAFGDFWSYMLVAEGAVDIATEPELEVYDMAALVPIVVEAGGSFTSLDGVPGPFGGNAIATNGLLHEAARQALA